MDDIEATIAMTLKSKPIVEILRRKATVARKITTVNRASSITSKDVEQIIEYQRSLRRAIIISS